MNKIDIGDRNHLTLAELNQASLLRIGLMLAMACLFASTAPAGLVLASLSSLLFLSAIGIAALAAVIGEHPLAPHFTRWDETAFLMLSSMIISALVDREAVMAIVNGLPKG
ncbi:MAG: hypothetical protein GC191_03855 [Azospirillum sp.]|nr:hypothetical protein [Azospirillum sp.]